MKKLLSLLLTLAMACSLAVTASAEEAVVTAADPDLTGSTIILHTNDVHGGIAGYAQVSALKQYYQKCGAYVLLFDAGDFIQGDPTVSASQGTTAIELMNLAGYDAAALGNHEFDYGYDNLVKLSKAAKFPILSANTLYNGRLPSATTRSSPRRTAPRSACSAWRPRRPPPRPTLVRSRASPSLPDKRCSRLPRSKWTL